MINALKNIGIHIYPKSSSRKNAHLFPFWGKNARLMSHFRPNVFFGKMFSRFWDIQQNDFGTIGMQQSSKWPNVFFGKMFSRFWDIQQNDFGTIGMQQSSKWPNVFSWKMFSRFWDIQQNDFGTIGMQQSSKWPNVFSWKMFPRFWDMHTWCFFLSCDWNPMSLQKSMCK
jgi:predicted nucleic-acid-binding Zn-ribbon protein